MIKSFDMKMYENRYLCIFIKTSQRMSRSSEEAWKVGQNRNTTFFYERRKSIKNLRE